MSNFSTPESVSAFSLAWDYVGSVPREARIGGSTLHVPNVMEAEQRFSNWMMMTGLTSTQSPG